MAERVTLQRAAWDAAAVFRRVGARLRAEAEAEGREVVVELPSEDDRFGGDAGAGQAVGS